MTFFEWVEDRLGHFVLQAVFVIVSTTVLLSKGTSIGIITLLLIMWFFFFIGIQAIQFVKMRSHLCELECIMDNLDEKYLFAECIPKPQSIYERKLFDLSRRAGMAMISNVSNARGSYQEYQEYVESWVHEIKTPITAAGLICRNADLEIRRKLAPELAKIEAHVERALFYARLENPEKDMIICQTSLEEIAAKSIEQYKTLMIQNNIRLELENIDQIVYTDKKWLVFVLGQLFQNAVQYKSEAPVISLVSRRLGNQVQLMVQDNGIGIESHELPRVFDRGFTGSNGRSRGGSTGMGLYLCHRLADYLQIDIKVNSRVNQGTCVTLTFPAKQNLTKL